MIKGLSQGKYPSTFYRVSFKAIIRDEQNRILMVYEADSWDLPGGGVEFGETPKQTLVREFKEELAITAADFDYEIVGCETWFHKGRECWAMNLICEVTFKQTPGFSVGNDSEAIRFMTQEEVAELENGGAKLAYEWAFGEKK